MYVALSILAVFAVLVLSEIAWRGHKIRGELGRKTVHMTVGSFVAFWPFFMSWNEIRLLSLAFLVVVIISDRFKIFKAIHSVQRPTFGEICFALVVGALTFVTHSKGIYAAALLQMSLADGLAAVVGTRYGRRNTYKIFKHGKSVVGTLTFMVVSALIFAGYAAFGVGNSLPTLHEAAAGVVGGAILENLGLFGLDNLLVPLFVGYLLSNW